MLISSLIDKQQSHPKHDNRRDQNQGDNATLGGGIEGATNRNDWEPGRTSLAAPEAEIWCGSCDIF